MPTAVIAQPIRIAPASALAAMFCGREKIPPPIIEPTTNAINALRRSLLGDCDIIASPFFRGRQLPRERHITGVNQTAEE